MQSRQKARLQQPQQQQLPAQVNGLGAVSEERDLCGNVSDSSSRSGSRLSQNTFHDHPSVSNTFRLAGRKNIKRSISSSPKLISSKDDVEPKSESLKSVRIINSHVHGSRSRSPIVSDVGTGSGKNMQPVECRVPSSREKVRPLSAGSRALSDSFHIDLFSAQDQQQAPLVASSVSADRLSTLGQNDEMIENSELSKSSEEKSLQNPIDTNLVTVTDSTISSSNDVVSESVPVDSDSNSINSILSVSDNVNLTDKSSNGTTEDGQSLTSSIDKDNVNLTDKSNGTTEDSQSLTPWIDKDREEQVTNILESETTSGHLKDSLDPSTITDENRPVDLSERRHSRSIEVTQLPKGVEFHDSDDSDEDDVRQKLAKAEEKEKREKEEDELGRSDLAEGRFLKFDVTIGRGSFKAVFKGLDTETGVHVAWCELQVSRVTFDQFFLVTESLITVIILFHIV